MTQDQVVHGALLYKNGELAGQKAVVGVTHQAVFNDKRMVEAMAKNTDALIKGFKNIPEHHSEYDNIKNIYTEFKKQGNRIERNHKPLGGVFS